MEGQGGGRRGGDGEHGAEGGNASAPEKTARRHGRYPLLLFDWYMHSTGFYCCFLRLFLVWCDTCFESFLFLPVRTLRKSAYNRVPEKHVWQRPGGVRNLSRVDLEQQTTKHGGQHQSLRRGTLKAHKRLAIPPFC